MYLMTGVSSKTNKRWYKLYLINKEENSKTWNFVTESVANALKSCGVKMYENSSVEVA